MTTVDPLTSKCIATSKFLLISGVILIHSDLDTVLPPSETATEAGLIMKYMSCAMQACIAFFFSLSGYLFFNNIEKFSFGTYVSKLRKRISTLLVPYIIWNSFAVALQIYKSGNPIYTDYGLIADGSINLYVLLKGFWTIDGPYPWGVALWFIRNLMLFVIATPLVYLICKNVFVAATSFVILISMSVPYYISGIEWFIAGAFFSINHFSLRPFSKLSAFAAAIVIWISGVAIIQNSNDWQYPIGLFLRNAGAFVAIWSVASYLIYANNRYEKLKPFIESTFFLYASHQLYINFTKRLVLRYSGYGNQSLLLLDYVAVFILLFSISYAFYILIKRISPKTLALLTGNRI